MVSKRKNDKKVKLTSGHGVEIGSANSGVHDLDIDVVVTERLDLVGVVDEFEVSLDRVFALSGPSFEFVIGRRHFVLICYVLLCREQSRTETIEEEREERDGNRSG